LPKVSTSFGEEGKSSEAREDSEVEDEDGRGLSAGEMAAEEVGVESVVASRRRAASCGKAVVDIAEKTGEPEEGRLPRQTEFYLRKM
jgi:hypothetical protein